MMSTRFDRSSSSQVDPRPAQTNQKLVLVGLVNVGFWNVLKSPLNHFVSVPEIWPMETVLGHAQAPPKQGLYEPRSAASARVEVLEFLERLVAEVVAIHQKQDALGAGRADQPPGE